MSFRLTSPPPSRAQLRLTKTTIGGLPIIAEDFPLETSSSVTAPTQGTIFGASVGLYAGDTITNVLTALSIAAAGANPTLVRLGLADSAGKVLAVTANLNASAIWTAAGLGVAVAPLSAPYAIPASGIYTVLFVQVGAWGGTQVQLLRAPTAAITGGGAAIGSSTPVRGGSYGAGQTDLPAVGASLGAGSGNTCLWFGLN